MRLFLRLNYFERQDLVCVAHCLFVKFSANRLSLLLDQIRRLEAVGVAVIVTSNRVDLVNLHAVANLEEATGICLLGTGDNVKLCT